MACNCKKTVDRSKYEFTDANGKKTTYTSQVDARAAQIRAGGKGTIKPVR